VLRVVKSFFFDFSKDSRFKIRPTSALFTLMAVVLFSFGIYTNLHSLSVTRAIQKQAAIESSQQSTSTTPTTSTASSTPTTTTSNVNETKPSAHAIAAYSVAPDKPKYITIPSLGVYARVIEVGVTKDNSVGTPSNTSDTAWFNQSAKPGQNGAAFIDGHVLGPIHGGVFAGLKNIQSGAQITITMGDNTTYSYTVKKTAIVSKDAIDMNSLLKSVDSTKQGLNLMTCTGTYISSQATYNNRFIVYAVRN
jgi:sortase (surface protein transpeptidase)